MKKISLPTHLPEKPVFIGFDIDNPNNLPGYNRNLPHVRLTEATYFVTFRLADSIPKSVLESWRLQRAEWLKAHGVDPDLQNTDSEAWRNAYFSIPSDMRAVFEQQQRCQFFVEIDKCHGSCILRHSNQRQIVVQALEYFHGQRIWCGDYVVMPNHVHILIQPFPGMRLEEWLYSVKKFTGRRIDLELKEEKNSVWQKESYDRIVRNSNELRRMRKYIADNPSKLLPGAYSLRQLAWLDPYVEQSSHL